MITIRKAEANEQDIDLINGLSELSFNATYQDILSAEQLVYMFDMMYSKPSLWEQLTELDHRYYIAYVDNVPCAYVSISQISQQHFELNKIYIIPSAQSLGLGGYLINFVKRYALEHSGNKKASITLHVNRNNKAKGFYEHMGFWVDSEGDFDIGNGYFMNDYIMKTEVGD